MCRHINEKHCAKEINTNDADVQDKWQVGKENTQSKYYQAWKECENWMREWDKATDKNSVE